VHFKVRDVGQRAVKCDESALEKCFERLLVVFVSERVSVLFCGMTKVFEEVHDGSVVIVEQTRWRHATVEAVGSSLVVLCSRSRWLALDWRAIHFLGRILTFRVASSIPSTLSVRFED
jgi:hypothetical protein